MDNLQTDTKSEIARIFDEYRMKLEEIAKKLDEEYPQPVDEESDNSIGSNSQELAEIIATRHHKLKNIPEVVEQQANEEASL